MNGYECAMARHTTTSIDVTQQSIFTLLSLSCFLRQADETTGEGLDTLETRLLLDIQEELEKRKHGIRA